MYFPEIYCVYYDLYWYAIIVATALNEGKVNKFKKGLLLLLMLLFYYLHFYYFY